MGLFSGLKNFITGGGAEVDLDMGEAVRGEPMAVNVSVKVGDSDVEIRQVYVRLRAREIIDVPDVQVVDADGDKSAIKNIKEAAHRGLHRTEQTFNQEFQVSGAQTLESGQSYTFEGEVMLPVDVPPSFTGRYAKHVWQVTAALDKPGNDPDSGWVDIDVR